MLANDRIFISHTHTDNALCQPIKDALDSWGADYWLDTSNGAIGQGLMAQILTNMRDRDVLIRVCTGNTATSHWMDREFGMYLAYQHDRKQRDPQHEGKLITLRFPGYEPDAFDQTYLYIDATSGPRASWLDRLRIALEKPLGWVKFENDDKGYQWWVGTYPQGYVVNAERRPKPSYLMLHRATCRYINDVVDRYEEGALTGRGYIKICALERTELERWAQLEVGPTSDLNSELQLHGTRLLVARGSRQRRSLEERDQAHSRFLPGRNGPCYSNRDRLAPCAR